MTEFTPNLNLRKPNPDPENGDNVNVQQDLNANWDKIDAAVGNLQDTISQGPMTLYYASNGAFTKANYPWAKRIRVRMVGGGGGGGGCVATGAGQAASSGGGGGAYAEKWIDISALAATETITIGTGGVGGDTSGSNGSAGGTSSFGSHCSAGGGDGGEGAASASSGSVITFGGNGGVAGTADLILPGGDGGDGIRANGVVCSVGYGGATILGASRRGGSTDSGEAGRQGHLYGGGGSGAYNNQNQAAKTGGNGRNGIVIVEVY